MIASAQYILRPESVELEIPAVSAGEAIAMITSSLAYAPEVRNFSAFRAAVMAGEETHPTVVEYGIAFPHARTDHVSQIVMAAGRSTAGVYFGEDQDPVHLIFVIGTPKDRAHEYLQLVSSLARSLQSPWVREGLMQASTPEDFLSQLRP